MRALIIAEPWIDHILDGHKVLEFRTRNTNIRERIGLIRKGSGTIVGTCELAGTIGPATAHELAILPGHTSTTAGLEEYSKGKLLYAWKLSNVEKLNVPLPYKHPHGAQSWVRL